MKPIQTLAIAGPLALAAGGVAFAGHLYSDVPHQHWAESSIEWASQSGIMTGPGDKPGRFEPEGIVNRAQLATTLARYFDRYNKNDDAIQNRVDVLENTIDDLMERMDDFDGRSSSSSSRSSSMSNMSGMSSSRSSTSSRSSMSSINSASATEFQTFLSTANEVPPTTGTGSGIGSFSLKDDDLHYAISFLGLSGPPTAAHIHRGFASENGPIIVTIPTGQNSAAGVWLNLSTDLIADLRAGRLYFNVHTAKYPNGEIRGQLVAR